MVADLNESTYQTLKKLALGSTYVLSPDLNALRRFDVGSFAWTNAQRAGGVEFTVSPDGMIKFLKVKKQPTM